MLKQLWKKLGNEFLQGSCDRQSDAQLHGESISDNCGVRLVPHITHTGEFHLERLANLIKVRYGQSMPVDSGLTISDQTLRDVISFAARIQDQDIQRELLLFYLNCSPVIQEFLRAETDLGKSRLPF